MADIEDMDAELASSTSNDETLDAATDAANNGATEADATSSSANDESEQSTIDVVRDVVSEARGKTDAPASSADGDGGGSAADGQTPKEPDNEGYTDVPFHKHPRFQALITERNGLRTDATRYRNIETFMQTNNLNAEEAANALSTFALAKVDPARAFAELKPWLQELLVAAGEILPADLQKRVEAGELTAETAMELSRERAKSKSHETRQTFDQQRSQRDGEVAQENARVTAASDWEKDRKLKDPNFEAKQPLLMREIAFLQMQNGKPKTADEVRAQLKEAYDNVNKTFVPPARQQQQPQRQKPPIKPVTGGTVSGNVREAPKTTLDIIRANRRATG